MGFDYYGNLLYLEKEYIYFEIDLFMGLCEAKMPRCCGVGMDILVRAVDFNSLI